MDKLPAELLERIFLLACTDGGRTGRSLALTSKFIHAVSRTSRFHTIALALGSPSQVVQFVACFNAECALSKEAKIRVRHLCLGSAQQQAFPSSPENKEHQLTTPDNAKEQLTALRKETQRYYRDMMVVLQLLAPDLYTLCILDPECDAVLHIPMLQSAGFPRLVELVTVGREPAGWRTSDACTPFYPRLRTYQRVLQPEFCPWGFRPPREPKVERWREVAPKLIDLHVFEIGYKRNVPDLCWALLEHPAMHLSSELRELVARCPPVPPPPPPPPP
ncbi:hypothetical protein C8Q78DRAFT_1066122 [Trametes maxima]|nr:hypothetical protein C8Q78DRAFT_1066122 [Trametes maxima]